MFLARFFEGDHFQQLSDETMDAHSDEALIAKIADYLEVTHFKQYMGMLTEEDIKMIVPALEGKIQKLQDEVTKSTMQSFLEEWKVGLRDGDLLSILKRRAN